MREEMPARRRGSPSVQAPAPQHHHGLNLAHCAADEHLPLASLPRPQPRAPAASCLRRATRDAPPAAVELTPCTWAGAATSLSPSSLSRVPQVILLAEGARYRAGVLPNHGCGVPAAVTAARRRCGSMGPSPLMAAFRCRMCRSRQIRSSAWTRRVATGSSMVLQRVMCRW